MGSLRSSAQAHDLGHLATECLAANRNRSSGGPKRPAVVSQVNQVLVNWPHQRAWQGAHSQESVQSREPGITDPARRPGLGQWAAVKRGMRALEDIQLEPVAAAAAALSGLLLVGAFGASLASAGVRGASLAAAGALLALVGTGLSLYAWRLGVPGRSS